MHNIIKYNVILNEYNKNEIEKHPNLKNTNKCIKLYAQINELQKKYDKEKKVVLKNKIKKEINKCKRELKKVDIHGEFTNTNEFDNKINESKKNAKINVVIDDSIQKHSISIPKVLLPKNNKYSSPLYNHNNKDWNQNTSQKLLNKIHDSVKTILYNAKKVYFNSVLNQKKISKPLFFSALKKEIICSIRHRIPDTNDHRHCRNNYFYTHSYCTAKENEIYISKNFYKMDTKNKQTQKRLAYPVNNLLYNNVLLCYADIIDNLELTMNSWNTIFSESFHSSLYSRMDKNKAIKKMSRWKSAVQSSAARINDGKEVQMSELNNVLNINMNIIQKKTLQQATTTKLTKKKYRQRNKNRKKVSWKDNKNCENNDEIDLYAKHKYIETANKQSAIK